MAGHDSARVLKNSAIQSDCQEYPYHDMQGNAMTKNISVTVRLFHDVS